MKKLKNWKTLNYLWLFICLLVNFPSFSCTPPSLRDFKYDLYFQAAVGKFMAGQDWRVVKAMCYQESLYDHMAVSSVGAMGVCQLMPDTFKWVVKRVGMNGADVFKAKDNIYAGVAYLSWIHGQWSPKRTSWQRFELTFASYNAGIGNVLKAQKTCNNSMVWKVIKGCLHDVTGKNNSEQTIDYVSKIERWYGELKVCQPNDLQGYNLYAIIEFVSKLYNVYTAMEIWLQQSHNEGVSGNEQRQHAIV